MNSLNILHISDAHIQLDAKEEVSEIVVKMINDALKVQKEQDIKIDLVCFTGDLIQRGDKALDDEKQLEIAEEILVNPLLNSLGLENNKFIIIPGNHEVDVKKIVKATEKGLLVDSLEEINDNVSDMNESYLARLDYFYQWIDNYYDDIIREKIGYAFLREINGKKIGIACIDSAWRSSGKGGCEKGIMYVGQKQINDLYKHIKDADIKICLMHHPTDWLSDYESTIIERELTKFDIVLRGHVHENDHKEVCRQSMKTIYSTAGKIYPLDYAFGRAVDGYNGYSILNIDFNNSLCNIFLRTYYAKDRNDFDSAINLVENGQVSYPLNGNIAEKQMEFNIVNGIHNYFTNMSETLSLIKEIDTYSPLDIEEVFVEPILSEESEYVSESSGKVETICLDELLDDTDNVILFGKKESGKTTILQQIGLKYIDKYNELEIIPVHIDMRNLPKKSDKLTNAAVYFVMKNMFDDATIRKEKVKELIDNGKIVFLIDNIDISNARQAICVSGNERIEPHVRELDDVDINNIESDWIEKCYIKCTQEKNKKIESLFNAIRWINKVGNSTNKGDNIIYCVMALGMLIIDESGQAVPQSALGAIYRTRRAVVVGDPLQVEPVVTIPKVLIDILADSTCVANAYKVIENSVQTFSDNINEFNGMIGERQVGCPLVVHRRCIEPMFSISNLISYDNRMFNKTNKKEEYLKPENLFLIKKSGWINVEGEENGGKDHFVKNQAERVCQLMEDAVHIYSDLFGTDDKIFIITPFRTVAESMRKFIISYFSVKGYDKQILSKWTKNCVGTVHTFQGKDANEVLLVLGCSNKSAGAMNWVVKKANILNVACTRAKYRIAFIGNINDWKNRRYFREFIPSFIDIINV